MTEPPHRTASFSGERSGVFPCTWGQRDVWCEMERTGNPDHGNLVAGGFLPPGHTVDEVVAAVGELMRRYESLRTQFFRADDGQLVQRVLESGEVDVEIVDVGPDVGETVQRWAAEVQNQSYDLAEDLLFRARIGLVDGAPLVIILGMPHMVVDFLGSRVLVDELRRILEGSPPAEPTGWQPVEKAEQERSPQGQRVLRRALDYWRWAVDVTPPAAFDNTRYEPGRPRYQRGCLSSRAIPGALDQLAERYRVGTSHVLLAAMAVLLGRYTGLPSCLTRVVVGNRGKPELRNAVVTLTQETVAVLDLSPDRFEDVVRAARSSSLNAMRHGQYAPEAAAEIVAEAGATLDVYFNDMWTATRGGKGAPVEESTDAPESTETTFHWGRANDWANVAFFLESSAVMGDDSAIELSLLADTARIPVPAIRTFLFAIEELLVTLAENDSRPLADIELVHDPCAEAGLVPDPVG